MMRYQRSSSYQNVMRSNRYKPILVILLVLLAAFLILRFTGVGGLDSASFETQRNAKIRSEMQHALSSVNNLSRLGATSTSSVLARVRQYVHGIEVVNDLNVSMYGEVGRLYDVSTFDNIYAIIDNYDSCLASGQKVNDALGNPIIIGSVVIWHVADPTRAVFAVDNFEDYLSIQCDSTIRNIARLYPYDSMKDGDDEDDGEKTLRGSSSEVSEIMQNELSQRVADAGLVIEDVRITTLAYSDEIAAAMLQRQQAVAIIAARQKIVEGAVSMVKMAIDQLSEDEVVVLDEERKAAMVSNLLVVLCGNKDAQPIVNSGSIY